MPRLTHQAKLAVAGAFALVLAAYVALALTNANAQDTSATPSASPMASPGASPVASPVGSPVAVDGAQTAVTVEMVDIAFKPAQITIAANTDVTVTLPNNGVAVHNFNVDELNVHSGDIAGGASATVTINAAPGTYAYYCSVPGHKEAGMIGQLIVQ